MIRRELVLPGRIQIVSWVSNKFRITICIRNRRALYSFTMHSHRTTVNKRMTKTDETSQSRRTGIMVIIEMVRDCCSYITFLILIGFSDSVNILWWHLANTYFNKIWAAGLWAPHPERAQCFYGCVISVKLFLQKYHFFYKCSQFKIPFDMRLYFNEIFFIPYKFLRYVWRVRAQTFGMNEFFNIFKMIFT